MNFQIVVKFLVDYLLESVESRLIFPLLALIWLVLMALNSAAIIKDSISFFQFLLPDNFWVIPSIMSYFRRLNSRIVVFLLLLSLDSVILRYFLLFIHSSSDTTAPSNQLSMIVSLFFYPSFVVNWILSMSSLLNRHQFHCPHVHIYEFFSFSSLRVAQSIFTWEMAQIFIPLIRFLLRKFSIDSEVLISYIIIIIIIIIDTPFRVFHTGVSRWFLTGVWVTASLPKSPGLFSVSWLILTTLQCGWSSIDFLFPSPLAL